MPEPPATRINTYRVLIEHIFLELWREGQTQFEFERDDIRKTAEKLSIPLPKNLGDVTYALRYRIALSDRILATQPAGKEWIIEGAGRARYRFKLVRQTRIRPREDLATIAIPNATPELIAQYRLDDEQALLAIVRYNRLIDTFLGLTTYSLQNHLRTVVKGIGQIEIDELYIGLDKHGCHYVIPVQAKGGKDQIGIVQTSQDIQFAAQRFPNMRCKPIAMQFMSDDIIAMFELVLQDGELRVSEERHYKLVRAAELDQRTVTAYSA